MAATKNPGYDALLAYIANNSPDHPWDGLVIGPRVNRNAINLHAVDFKAQKIQLSDSAWLDLKGLTSVQRFTVKYSSVVKEHLFKEDEYGYPQILTVVAIIKRKGHFESCVFLHSSDEILGRLADEFMLAYSLEASSPIYYNTVWDELEENEPMRNTKYIRGETKYNAKRFVEAIKEMPKDVFAAAPAYMYKAKCSFLSFLLEAGRKKRLDSAAGKIQWDPDDRFAPSDYEYEITDCRFSIPDSKKDFVLKAEGCLTSGNWDFEGLYNVVCSFLPQNLKRKIQLEAEQLTEAFGKDFAKKAEILENYRLSVSAQDFTEQRNIIQPEIDRWTKLVTDEIAERKFGEEYVALLGEKMKILEDAVLHELQKYDFDPEQKEQCKDRLLKRLERIQEGSVSREEDWYQEYLGREAWLKEMARNVPENMNYMKIPQYYEFYRHGRVLIGNRISRLKKGRTCKTGELDDAMLYFYETATPEEAYTLEKRIENRKKGLSGEREVDHVLEWLEAGGSYKRVPKIWSKKDRAYMIKLYNPSYIKYAQEYDQIIVGPQGVFVIETKNYAGKIKVDANGNWSRIKRGGSCEGEKSPVQQVDRHVKLLQSFLTDGIPLIGVICISHPSAMIEGAENCSIPLVKSDLLHNFIENYPSENKVLSKEEIENCLLLIENHRYQEEKL